MSTLSQTKPLHETKPSDSETPTHRTAQLLADNVTQLMTSETYIKALQFRKKFHSYSFNNVFLIYLQCPEATQVAGYRKWQEMGRQVNKGETSIAILAPLVRKLKNEETGEEEPRVVGFKTASVFDIS